MSATLRLAGLNLCVQSLRAAAPAPTLHLPAGQVAQAIATVAPCLGTKWLVGLGLVLFSNEMFLRELQAVANHPVLRASHWA